MAGLNLLCFFPVYAGTAFLYWRDVIRNYAPNKWWMADRLLRGELPLWNDSIHGGLPFWGDPVQSVLYPGNLLFLPLHGLHPLHAYGIVTAIHYLLAHAGYRKLFRTLGAGPAAAGSAAGCLAYCPMALELTWGFQFLCAFSLLGWALDALVSHRREPDRRSFLRLSVWTALLASTGDIQGLYLFGTVAGVALLLAPKDRTRSLALGMAGLLTGVAVTAVMLAPGFEFASGSSRRVENTVQRALSWSWHPARTIEWAAPGIFVPAPGIELNYERFTREPNNRKQPFYFPAAGPGILVAACIPLWFFLFRRDPRAIWMSAAAAVCLLLALGENLPFYGWCRNLLPLWANFRFPERLLLYAYIGFAALAALVLSDERIPSGRASKILVAILPAFSAAGVLMSGDRSLLTEALGFSATGPYAPLVQVAFLKALVPFCVFAPAALLGSSPRLRQAAFAGIVVWEVFAVNGRALRFIPPETVAGRPAILDGIAGANTRPVPPPVRIRPRLLPREYTGDRESGVASDEWNMANDDLVMLWGLSSVDGYSSALTLDSYYSGWIDPQVRWRLMGLEMAVSPADTPPGLRWECGDGTGASGARLCRDPASFGPVRAPLSWEVAASGEDLKGKLLSEDWDPAQIEYLGPRLSGLPVPVSNIASGSSSGAGIRIAEWTPEFRRLLIERETPGPVVLSDNYFTGWKVSVDGADAPAIVANGFQLAAWVPAGRHVVDFSYLPESLGLGAGISAAALSLLLLLGFARTGPEA